MISGIHWFFKDLGLFNLYVLNLKIICFRDAMSTLSNWKPSDIHVIGVKQHLDDVIYINIAITDHGRVVR